MKEFLRKTTPVLMFALGFTLVTFVGCGKNDKNDPVNTVPGGVIGGNPFPSCPTGQYWDGTQCLQQQSGYPGGGYQPPAPTATLRICYGRDAATEEHGNKILTTPCGYQRAVFGHVGETECTQIHGTCLFTCSNVSVYGSPGGACYEQWGPIYQYSASRRR